VHGRWILLAAMTAATAIAGVIDAVDTDPQRPPIAHEWEIIAIACWLLGLIVLPAVTGAHWRGVRGLIAIALGWILGLVIVDALTYDTLWHRCNDPQPDGCDPGPIPATFLILATPIVLLTAAVGRGASNQIRKRRREQPHLVVGADRHADRARGAEGS
jgi:hypothetical protein